jgi:hypothetical protein
MSTLGGSGAPSSSHKRFSSIFRRPTPSPLSQTDSSESHDVKPPKVLQKQDRSHDIDPPKVLQKKDRTFSFRSQVSNKSSDNESDTVSHRKPARLRIPSRSSIASPQYSKPKEEFEEALWSTTSSQAPSIKWNDTHEPRSGSVVLHGEVQTSCSLWRKTREYIVITEGYIDRYKSQAKAAHAFTEIPPAKRHHTRHSSSPSVTSISEVYSPMSPGSISDDNIDRATRIDLSRVVAVNNHIDARPYFAVEIFWVDEQNSESIRCLVLQLKDPDSRDLWLSVLLKQTKKAISEHPPTIHPRFLFKVQEYDVASDIPEPNSDNVFFVARRTSDGLTSPNAPAALEKSSPNACLLAIGSNRVHFIPLASSERTQSFGLVTLFAIDVAELDDSMTLTFRPPMRPATEVQISSTRSQELVFCLYRQLKRIRPRWRVKLCPISGPSSVRRRMSNEEDSEPSGLEAFSRTLNAYLVGYGRSADAVHYRVETLDGALRFQLLVPERRRYSRLDLLAVTRALAYSNCFHTISFANVSLDELNLSYDAYGSEHTDSILKKISKTKQPAFDLSQSSLLPQEVASIAGTNRNLLQLDFSNSISAMSISGDSESGILQALYPLCIRELTNVEWLSLSGIRLSNSDLECLWLLADDKRAHLRGLDLSHTSLTQQKLTHLFTALREQENTFESLNLSSNGACLNQCMFDMQIQPFPYLRVLDLSHLALSPEILEPLISAPTLNLWRLQDLSFSGTLLNDASVHSLCL